MPSLCCPGFWLASVTSGPSYHHLSPGSRLPLARPFQAGTIGRSSPASASCGSTRQQVSSGWRFAPACCAAQSVHGCAARAEHVSLVHRRAGGAMGQRPGRLTAAASSGSAVAPPLYSRLPFSCHRCKARPNMSVNRSLHGMPPWPRRARCPCCASRPTRHAVPARLPLLQGLPHLRKRDQAVIEPHRGSSRNKALFGVARVVGLRVNRLSRVRTGSTTSGH